MCWLLLLMVVTLDIAVEKEKYIKLRATTPSAPLHSIIVNEAMLFYCNANAMMAATQPAISEKAWVLEAEGL